jgi:hypothetical protein
MGTICQRILFSGKYPILVETLNYFIQEETWKESKSSKNGGSEENLALVSKTRKGKGKGSSK